MWLIVVPFLVGLLIGWRNTITPRLSRFLNSVMLATLLLLLLTMGARVGGDPRVITHLQEMGVQAMAIAVAAVAGSVLAVRVALHGWFGE